jgi:hypothetical protein
MQQRLEPGKQSDQAWDRMFSTTCSTVGATPQTHNSPVPDLYLSLNDEVMVIKVLALLALLSCAACQDAGFECAWRSLAYDYGRELLPAYGAFPTLFDALELASLCNHTQPESRMDGALPAPLNGPSVKIGTGDGIYVDPAAGSDR